MGLISWIVLGLLAGFIGSKLVDNRGRGALVDILLGIVGAVVGGRLVGYFGYAGVTGLTLWSLGVATLGAVITLLIAHVIRRML